MKKIILSTLLLLGSIVTFSQSCLPPSCSFVVKLNQNGYTGNVNDYNNASKNTACFEAVGSIGRITTNMSFNGISNWIFKPADPRYEVVPPINMQGVHKVYVQSGSDVTLSLLSMNGGDTVFVAGSLHITTVGNVNNSIPTKRAVIVISAGGSVDINGVPQSTGTVYQSGGNASNQIDLIQGCNLTTLPVKFESFTAKHLEGNNFEVSFKVGDAELVNKFTVLVSKNGKDFVPVTIVLPDNVNPNITYKVKIQVK